MENKAGAATGESKKRGWRVITNRALLTYSAHGNAGLKSGKIGRYFNDAGFRFLYGRIEVCCRAYIYIKAKPKLGSTGALIKGNLIAGRAGKVPKGYLTASAGEHNSSCIAASVNIISKADRIV